MAAVYSVLLIAGLAYFRPFAHKTTASSVHPPRVAIDVSPDDITSLTLERGDKRIVCRRTEDRWQIVAPRGASFSADLAERIVSSLAGTEQTVDVVKTSFAPQDLEQFGLSKDITVIRLGTKTGGEASVELGALNPAGSAVYARASSSPEILLVGFNVRYYADLAFEGAFARKRAEARTATVSR